MAHRKIIIEIYGTCMSPFWLCPMKLLWQNAKVLKWRVCFRQILRGSKVLPDIYVHKRDVPGRLSHIGLLGRVTLKRNVIYDLAVY